MRVFEGKLLEWVLLGGQVGAWVECASRWMPAPGQYLLAHTPTQPDAPLAVPLFPAAFSARGFLAAPPLPAEWTPGTLLSLAGPLGRGFRLEAHPRRLALAAFGESLARLLPLAARALESGAAVTVFTGSPLPDLPLSVEASPLASLPEALAWADCLALDLPAEDLPHLRQALGLGAHQGLPCPAEALVQIPMPCAGAGECGACAVPARRGWKLACQEGPVFALEDLEW
jgi:hypothetical protein